MRNLTFFIYCNQCLLFFASSSFLFFPFSVNDNSFHLLWLKMAFTLFLYLLHVCSFRKKLLALPSKYPEFDCLSLWSLLPTYSRLSLFLPWNSKVFSD